MMDRVFTPRDCHSGSYCVTHRRPTSGYLQFSDRSPMIPARCVPGMNTVRMRFRADALWGESRGLAAETPDNSNPFVFLQVGERAVERPALDWVCKRLVVELGAPARKPGPDQPGCGGAFVTQTRPERGRHGDVPKCRPFRHRCCGGSRRFGPCGAAGFHDCHCIGTTTSGSAS